MFARLFAPAALLTLISACGTTYIEIDVDRAEISAGGIDFATISAKVFKVGDPAANVKVTFVTTGGSFEQGQELLETEANTDGSGVATIKLYSGLKPGNATVTATFVNEASGDTATSSIAVEFTPPSGDAKPVDGTFRLICDVVNIGALRVPIPDIEVSCELTAQTRNGANIPASAFSVQFLAEAGNLEQRDDYYGNRVFVYSPRKGKSAPVDVEPDSQINEPSYVDGNGRTRNPRDGLVTMIAVVDGEEAFTDLNGNGEYDQGEPFVDSAEPFVDADDNDKWDAGEDYVDTNGNQRWDKANGTWDGNTKVMAIYKILWTGALDSSPDTSRVEAVTTTIAQGGSIEVFGYALDANLNPLAASHESSDSFEWTLSGYEVTSDDNLQPELSNSYGFEFDRTANSERKRWLILSNTFEPPKFTLTVRDYYPEDEDPPSSFSVNAQTHSTPGTDPDGYALDQVTEAITPGIDGSCN